MKGLPTPLMMEFTILIVPMMACFSNAEVAKPWSVGSSGQSEKEIEAKRGER